MDIRSRKITENRLLPLVRYSSDKQYTISFLYYSRCYNYVVLNRSQGHVFPLTFILFHYFILIANWCSSVVEEKQFSSLYLHVSKTTCLSNYFILGRSIHKSEKQSNTAIDILWLDNYNMQCKLHTKSGSQSSF